MKLGGILIIMFAIMSCSVNYKNEKIASLKLQDFITLSTSVKSAGDKGKLLPFLHGKLADDIKKMSDAEFKDKYISTNISLISLEVLESEILSEDKIQILYRIHYKKKEKTSDIEVESEKVSEMVFNDNQWKIEKIYDLTTKYIFPEGLSAKKGTVF